MISYVCLCSFNRGASTNFTQMDTLLMALLAAGFSQDSSGCLGRGRPWDSAWPGCPQAPSPRTAAPFFLNPLHAPLYTYHPWPRLACKKQIHFLGAKSLKVFWNLYKCFKMFHFLSTNIHTKVIAVSQKLRLQAVFSWLYMTQYRVYIFNMANSWSTAQKPHPPAVGKGAANQKKDDLKGEGRELELFRALESPLPSLRSNSGELWLSSI